jgi:catechol 2,3-dioxygenase-like lactoylglutathione lyase family enzyme
MIKEYSTGLQHIGIPACNLDESVAFYETLGFTVVHRKKTKHGETPVEVAFIKLDDLVIELFQLEGVLLDEIKQRQKGHIDHFAINVKSVDKLFEKMQASELTLLDNELQTIDIYEKGVTFFSILGPNKEVIEFNERMQ